jgi:hypothetical protein
MRLGRFTSTTLGSKEVSIEVLERNIGVGQLELVGPPQECSGTFADR